MLWFNAKKFRGSLNQVLGLLLLNLLVIWLTMTALNPFLFYIFNDILLFEIDSLFNMESKDSIWPLLSPFLRWDYWSFPFWVLIKIMYKKNASSEIQSLVLTCDSSLIAVLFKDKDNFVYIMNNFPTCSLVILSQ